MKSKEELLKRKQADIAKEEAAAKARARAAAVLKAEGVVKDAKAAQLKAEEVHLSVELLLSVLMDGHSRCEGSDAVITMILKLKLIRCCVAGSEEVCGEIPARLEGLDCRGAC